MAEQVERLAHHALRGEVWDKALEYCWQAGEKAMTRSAYHEAVEYFEQALRPLQHLPERAGQRRDRHRHPLVPHHGDEVLATPGRKRTGTEGRMRTHLRPS
jgi:hypothetical protein